MKKVYFFLFLLTCVIGLHAQIPTSCFEIESILVDACGTPEGDNEMMRLRIGPSPLNTASMTVTWYSNPWQGVCQNPTTALKTAAFNRSIRCCGWILEPPGGIIPAGAQVILFTSTAVDTLANSFADLCDTVYAVYQCPGAASGHFRNYDPGALVRFTLISFSSPAGCRDSAGYITNLLRTPSGSTGAADGASVDLSWSNVASYSNRGCTAPIVIRDVNAGNDTTICQGRPVRLNGTRTSVNGVFWSGGNGNFSRRDTAIATYTPASSDVYPIRLILNGYISCGDTLRDTMLINAFPNPVRTPNDTFVCQGSSVQVSVSGATTQNWSPGSSLSCTTCSNPIATPSSTTNYALNYTYGTCTAIDSVLITVSSRDSVFVPFRDTSICSALPLNLNSFSTNGYSWSPPASGLSCTACPNPVANITGTTTYFISSIGFCPDRDSIIVRPAPFNKPNAGNDTTICRGITFRRTATGVSAYNWNSSVGTSIFSCTSCSNPFISPGSTSPIQVYVNGTGTCEGIDTFVITVLPTDSIYLSFKDTTICSGDSIRLESFSTNGYNWTASASLSCTSCSNPFAFPTTTTSYFIRSSSPTCLDRDTVTVNILTSSNVRTINDTSICSGQSINLTTSGGASYTWSSPSGTASLSCTSCSSPVASPSSTITYFVSSSGSCSSSDTVTVTVNSTPVINVSNDTSVCSGTPLILFASGAPNFTWSVVSGSLSLSCTTCGTNAVTVSNSAVVQVTSVSSCPATDSIIINLTPTPIISIGNDTFVCASNPITFTGTGAPDFSWNSSAGTSVFSCTPCLSPVVNTASNITIYASAVGTACPASDTALLSVVVPGTLSTSSDTSICAGRSVNLSVSGGALYAWSSSAGTSSLSCINCANPVVTPTSTTSYYVASGLAACLTYDTVLVNVIPVSVLAATPDTTICAGNTLPLFVTGATAYQWSIVSGSPTLSCTNCSNPTLTQTGTSVIRVRNTDSACPDSITIRITQGTRDAVLPSPDTIICNGDNAQLYVNGVPPFTWSTSNGILSCTSCTSPQLITNTNATVYVRTGGACPSVDSVFVRVQPNVVITGLRDTTIERGQSAWLQASGGTFYTWSPTNGISQPNAGFTLAQPNNTTTYVVNTTDLYGCTGSDTVTVIVIDAVDGCVMLFPTGFTPNGDGVNDEFHLVNNVELNTYVLRVFNRYGGLVFETDRTNLGWDGTFLNREQPMGTYAFQAEGVCTNGKIINVNGAVTLIR